MDIFQRYRTFFLIEGIVFVLLGLIGIALPQVITLAVELLIGWLFLIGGGVQLVRSFTSKEALGFWPSLLGSVLSLAIGGLLLAKPLSGIISLTLLLTIFFIADGFSKLIFAFEYRTFRRWFWLAFSGLISLALAFIIWSGWPGTATWVIGLMVGINMLFFGISLLSLSFALKK